jgi:TolA-binding protein
MDRQHRQELKHDRFVDEVGSLTTRARENQKLLIGITAAIVAVFFIGYGIHFYRSNREHRAQDSLGFAIEAVDSPIAQPGQPPNPQAKFKSEQERTTKSEAMFQDVQKKYHGTDAADISNLYLARIAASKNNVASARKLLQDFMGEHPKHMLVGAARYSLYELRIDNGEAQQVAIELTQELSKTENQILPADTMLAILAHAYEAQGNVEKTKETYRRILTEFPDSPYALDAQRRGGGAA